MSSPSSTTTKPQPSESSELNASELAFKIGQLLLILFLFLVALNLMSGSFKLFGKGFAEQLVSITANPFVSLFIGMLATAVIQSSSTTTTLIVALVASGEISLINAVPLIMGANIGTSVTSTIVSLGHITKKDEYKLAVAGASVHDFFNIITVIVLFTLEVTTGVLSSSASWLAQMVSPQEGEKMGSAIFFVKDTAKGIMGLLGNNPYVVLPVGLLALFFSLQYLSKILRTLLVGQIEEKMNKYIFDRPIVSLLTGLVSTTAVQSSSVTSSLMVPLVATSKITLERAFPFLMGANIGTTTTALMAALFLDSDVATAALACAFAHLLFNLFGVCILFPIRPVRKIPIVLANGLGNLTMKNRLFGIGYIVVVFFIIPFILITLTT